MFDFITKLEAALNAAGCRDDWKIHYVSEYDEWIIEVGKDRILLNDLPSKGDIQ